jgi:S-formylglutathione hydrolase FrmB
MESCIVRKLPDIVAGTLPVDMTRQGIMGPSMSGHGALTLALRHPGHFASVSAFAPVCALIEDGGRLPALLVDQGTADGFLESQLKPQLLEAARAKAAIPLTMRHQEGYDHSYFFIAAFAEDHLRWHARALSPRHPDSAPRTPGRIGQGAGVVQIGRLLGYRGVRKPPVREGRIWFEGCPGRKAANPPRVGQS